MRFEHPWLLLALIPALSLAWFIGRSGGRTVPRRQHRIATWVRLTALALLVGAAAQDRKSVV